MCSGRPSSRTEAGADEVYFGFDHRHIVLRPALQNETGTKRSQVRNAGHVEENIFWQNRGQPGEDGEGGRGAMNRRPARGLVNRFMREHGPYAPANLVAADFARRYGRCGDWSRARRR